MQQTRGRILYKKVLLAYDGSVGSYLIKHLRCSVLVAQTEISDDQFARLTGSAAQA